ncbi:TetR/AcrR family transcriptional regulator [Vibrio splendidus]|uniref:TetR/AcrR family transcriptional regulator n=1 Tax=Vibrio splendidus TaxID=29497 RepID=UPI00148BBD7A|nr:TetR/AcrR family transcriptional regulator [Vibrio splendidus]NOJ02382.1 TetR/AcrR family transcriptional regulator [Vibrio splendidus]
MSEKAENTKRRIIEAAFDITLNEGFDAATFTRLSKQAVISRSGINTHFKRKEDLALELVSKYVEIIKQPLKFESADAFYQSWTEAFDNDSRFKKAILTAGPIIPKLDGVKGLFDSIQGDEQEVKSCVYKCVGYAVIHA